MKDNHSPYVCYCDQVTQEDIRQAVRKGACSPRQVIQMTGAMRHCDCKNKHPQGR